MKKNKDKFPFIALVLTFVGVFFIGVVALSIFFLSGRTIVVDGDGGGDCTTIQAGIDDADPGDIILVKASGGPYEENVDINTDNIKLIGIGKTQPVIDGTNDPGDGITIDSTSGVLVKNFIVRDFDNIGIFLENSNGNMVKGNNVNDNNDGILLESSNDNMFKKNTSFQNEEAGIFLNSSSGNMFKGNTANFNDEDGISLNSSNGNMFKGSTANFNGLDLGFSGFFVEDSDNNMFKGNTANFNGFDGIFLENNSNDNDVFGNRAFNNEDLDIENVNPDNNNFKGNKCGTSNQAGICN